jgi:polyisoprenoid-binding protein YceI
MEFKADKLRFDGITLTGAEGQLTLLGVTKPVKLSITHFKCGEHPMNKKPLCGAEVTTTIKRSEFGMTKYLPAVGDEVKISFPVEAYKD